MAVVLEAVMSGALDRAAEFITAFSPVLYVVGGIALGMWVLAWARGFFG